MTIRWAFGSPPFLAIMSRPTRLTTYTWRSQRAEMLLLDNGTDGVSQCVEVPALSQAPTSQFSVGAGGGNNGYVGVDVLCGVPSATPTPSGSSTPTPSTTPTGSPTPIAEWGQDDLIIVPNANLAPSPAAALPSPIPAPCAGMAPARDVTGAFSSLYLVDSVFPGDTTFPEPSTCGIETANTRPYVLEYTATSAGVAGDNGALCQGNNSCVPLAASPQVGNAGLFDTLPAPQKGCPQNQANCQIAANNGRITSAQIRLANFASQV